NSTTQQVVVLVAENIQSYLYAPLIGLLKTAQLEHPKVQGKIITLASGVIEDQSQMIAMLQQELQPEAFQDVEVRYLEGGQREVKLLVEIEPDNTAAEESAWLRPGGVYWITGGLGGLGRIFARHLIAQGQGLKIILSGRSPLDEPCQQQLDELL